MELRLRHKCLFALTTAIPSTVIGFTASLPRQHLEGNAMVTAKVSRVRRTQFSMVPLSNEEIFARAQERKAAEEEEQAPPPMLYEEDMLNDMQAGLLLLERRATEGPGTLTRLEIDRLDEKLNKIMTEMKLNEHLKPSRPAPSVSASVTTATNPYATSLAPQPVASPSARAESGHAGPMVIDMDTPSDEGAEYNGYGGMGQAADTRNTYIIPGMDEMSPEEYQRELQRSVIERQAERKRSGVTGNRSTWDYLNQLTGETGVLKKDPKKE